MGSPGEDLQLSPKARKLFAYTVECKARASFVGYKFYEQAKLKARLNISPIVFIKGNRKEPMVLMSAEQFFKLIANK